MCEASIIGAQVFSMRDGPALDTFRLRRAFTSDEDEKVRATRIIETTRQLLTGKRQILIDLGKENRHNRRLKPFSLPAEVQVSNGISEKFTVIEVSGLDRQGLLHQLTSAISDLDLTIGSAHIGTYGEKAVDVFYVTDLTGHKIEGQAQAAAHPRRPARRLRAPGPRPHRGAPGPAGRGLNSIEVLSALAKAPSPGWPTPSDLSPEGEVKLGTAMPHRHLSLGGEVGAKRQVRGPFPSAEAAT